MKINKNNIIPILSGLLCIVFGAIAASSSSNELFDRKHGQFIMLYDLQEKPEPEDDITSIVGEVGEAFAHIKKPFMVNTFLLSNFLTRNSRAETVDQCCRQSVDWDAWDAYKVPEEGFIYFVPKAYIQEHPNHGLLLRSEDRVSSDPQSLMDVVQKRESNIFNINILRHVFQVRSKSSIQLFERNQDIKKRLELESSAELLQEQKQLPIWDIVMSGHGSLEKIGVSVPEESTYIAGITVKNVKDMFKFFTNELYVGTVFIETCSVGGRNANLLQFDRVIGNNTLLRLNFTVILGSISDDVAMATNIGAKWNAFFTFAASAAWPLGNMLKALNEDTAPSHISVHGSTNIPQVWIPGGYGFQTYQVDTRVKILSKVLVAAHEDEQRTINIPNTTEVILVYPKKIDVPLKIDLLEKLMATHDELLMRNTAWHNVPSVVELLIDLPEATVSSMQDAPALAGLMTEYPNFRKHAESLIDAAYRYPGFVSMLKSANNEHTIKRIELAVAPSDNSALAGGVMEFIRDACVPSSAAQLGQSPQVLFQTYKINELTGINDISLLLELVRVKEGSEVSELENIMRPFIGQTITLENVVVRSVSKIVTIEFQFQDVTWSATIDYPGTLGNIGWKFSSSAAVDGALSSQEEKQLSISETLKKRMALAHVKEEPIETISDISATAETSTPAVQKGAWKSTIEKSRLAVLEETMDMVEGKVWVDTAGIGSLPGAKDPQVAGALGRLYRGFVINMPNSPFSSQEDRKTFLNAIRFAAETGNFRLLDEFAAQFSMVSLDDATLPQWIALAKRGLIPATANDE